MRPYRLSIGYIKGLKTPGRYGDGRGSHGLSLLIKKGTRGRLAHHWQQRIQAGINRDGSIRYTTLSLGQWPDVSLDAAREMAIDNARALKSGAVLAPERTVPLFHEAVAAVIELRAPGWKHAKTEQQWRTRLGNVNLQIGHLPVDRVTVQDVVKVILPIWGRPLGEFTLSYMKQVFDWVVAMQHRTDNPADNARALLPKNGHRATHQTALPYEDVGAALRAVRESNTAPMVKACLEFVALTAVRSGEARGATWDEFDLETQTWTLAGSRTKNGDPMRVPLSDAAVAVLRGVGVGTGLVFPSSNGKPFHDVSLSKVVKTLGVGTVHGLRSCFRDWAAEQTDAPREIAEMCLGHRIGGAVELAYRRTDYLERRRELMDQWAAAIS